MRPSNLVTQSENFCDIFSISGILSHEPRYSIKTRFQKAQIKDYATTTTIFAHHHFYNFRMNVRARFFANFILFKSRFKFQERWDQSKRIWRQRIIKISIYIISLPGDVSLAQTKLSRMQWHRTLTVGRKTLNTHCRVT